MITVDQALKLLGENRPDWGEEQLPLGQVTGRYLAQDITAPFSYPKASVSVMDGYAFGAQDGDKALAVIGESRAGEPYDGVLNTGEAVRIFTGALLPKGAESVEMQENAVLDDGRVSFSSLSTHRTFVRKAGSDFTKGDLLFRKREIITPAMILALATCNLETAAVRRVPSVALLSSGDELRPAGSPLKEGQIVNSIGPALSALLVQWGAKLIDLGIAKDDPEDIAAKIKNCEADIIVPIGGASIGKYDYMQSVANSLGFKPVFSKIAVKPGKPTWFSKRQNQCILGLPGNPSSAWVCAHVFLKHLILGPQKFETGIINHELSANGVRESFLRAERLANGKIQILERQDSGLVTPLARASILVRRHINAPKAKSGESTEFISL